MIENFFLYSNILKARKMRHVLAAGIILYRHLNETNRREFLLLQKMNGHEKWAPPKGRLEKNEDDFSAAVRETMEETGLVETRDYEFASRNFTVQTIYMTELKHKRIIFWLAKVNDSNVKIVLSSEHQDFKWFDLNDALALFKNEDLKRALREANDFLDSKIH